MELKRCAIFGIALISIAVNFVASQQTFGGVVSEDTTLDLSGSPYTITDDVLIDRDVALTIEPGVELLFNPGVGMVVNGSLIADGTETQRITLTAAVPVPGPGGTPYSWSGLTWLPGAGSQTVVDFVYGDHMTSIASSASILRYVNVAAAGALFTDDGNGMLLYSGTGPALEAVSEPPILDNVHVAENFGVGIDWQDISSVAAISDCNIENNNEGGMIFTSNGIGRLVVDGSVIQGNNDDGLFMDLMNRPGNSLNLPRYRFCSFSMDIDDNVYLDHDHTDFTDDPYECIQVNV